MEIEDIKAQAFVEGYEAEKLRLKAILTSVPAQTRMKLANHLAFETKFAPDEAVALLMAAAEETTAKVDTEASYLNEMLDAGSIGLGPVEDDTHSTWAAHAEKATANLEAQYGNEAISKGDE